MATHTSRRSVDELSLDVFEDICFEGDLNKVGLAFKNIREIEKRQTIDFDEIEAALFLGFLSAAAAGHLPVVQYLLSKAECQKSNFISFGLTQAAIQGHVDILTHLLSLGKTSKQENSAALRWACEGKKPNQEIIVKILLPVADPSEQNGAALATAASWGNLNVVKILVDFDKKLVTDSKLLTNAVYKGHLAVAEYLLQHTDPNEKNCEPLRMACAIENKDMLELLYPVSDVSLALRFMSEMKPKPPIASINFLKARMKMDENKNALWEGVPAEKRPREEKSEKERQVFKKKF